MHNYNIHSDDVMHAAFFPRQITKVCLPAQVSLHKQHISGEGTGTIVCQRAGRCWQGHYRACSKVGSMTLPLGRYS